MDLGESFDPLPSLRATVNKDKVREQAKRHQTPLPRFILEVKQSTLGRRDFY